MYNGYNVDPTLLESIDKLSKSLTEQFRAQLENEPSLRISPAAVERLNDILKEHFDESSRKAADFLSSVDIGQPLEPLKELSTTLSDGWRTAVESLEPALMNLSEQMKELYDEQDIGGETAEILKNEVLSAIDALPISDECKAEIFDSGPMLPLKNKDKLTRSEIIAAAALLIQIIQLIRDIFFS